MQNLRERGRPERVIGMKRAGNVIYLLVSRLLDNSDDDFRHYKANSFINVIAGLWLVYGL